MLTLGAMLAFASLLASCGDSASGPAEDATIASLTVSIEDGSVPPEFHTSSRIVLAGDTVTQTSLREYGEVVESETTKELTTDQRNDLERLVREADLREVDRVDDDCVGGGNVRASIRWSDETEISGSQDPVTYREGPGGRCNVYTLSGDLESVVDYLRSL